MSSLLHRRPSPAMVVAMIALFVSLSGVSYGLAMGSIGSREIKNNSVESEDIRNGSLVADDLRGGLSKSLQARATGHLPSSVYGRFKNGPVFTSDGPGDLLTLRLPAGNWIIFGKATAFVDVVEYECRLVAEGDFDRARLGNISGSGREVLMLTVLHRAAAAFTARLQCPDNNPSSGYQISDMKIHAVRAQTLSNNPG